jgi:hypothetical protein
MAMCFVGLMAGGDYDADGIAGIGESDSCETRGG